MAGPPSVLVVEDDAEIADAVLYALRKEGMAAGWARTLGAAMQGLGTTDAVVLDLGLPDGSGFSLLHAAAKLPDGPRMVVLTSRDEDVDCIAALEAGADDYVTKPFSPRALIARLRAMLRRGPRVDTGASAAKSASGKLSVGALTIDVDRRDASVGLRAMALTKIELDILAVLARAPGRVHTRDQLVERVWGGAYALAPRTVDSHVKALRRKLDAAGAPSGLLETVRSVGFRLQDVS